MINEDTLRVSPTTINSHNNNNNHQDFVHNYLANISDTAIVNGNHHNRHPHNKSKTIDDLIDNIGKCSSPLFELSSTMSQSPYSMNAYLGTNSIDGNLIMKYRNIGKNGLRVPLLAFSAWNSFGQCSQSTAEEVLTAAYENGINYFDTGDSFGAGQAEIMLGNVLKKKNWRRSSYIVSTKLFWKSGPTTHLGGGLSRKFIIEAVEASLQRLQLKYIDILLINKNDAYCPMEEIVRTMSYLINNGIIFYWGTSRFSPMHIAEAFSIARQFNCPPPICEQMEYHMFTRDKMELQMLELFHKSGIGCITWSPISLQNDDGIAMITRKHLMNHWDTKYNQEEKYGELAKLCEKLGCDQTQLSLAWCLQNENVNCILITATSIKELNQKLNAVKLYSLVTPVANEEIERILGNNPVLKRQLLQKAPSITIDVAEIEDL